MLGTTYLDGDTKSATNVFRLKLNYITGPILDSNLKIIKNMSP